jgi:hypothetical protein
VPLVDPTPPTDRIHPETALLLDPILDPHRMCETTRRSSGPASELDFPGHRSLRPRYSDRLAILDDFRNYLIRAASRSATLAAVVRTMRWQWWTSHPAPVPRNGPAPRVVHPDGRPGPMAESGAPRGQRRINV